MALREESQNLTAFITSMGLYNWKFNNWDCHLLLEHSKTKGNWFSLVFLTKLPWCLWTSYLSLGKRLRNVSLRTFEKRLQQVLAQLEKRGLNIKAPNVCCFRKELIFWGTLFQRKEWKGEGGRSRKNEITRQNERKSISAGFSRFI